jgi:hypothetical protein
MRNTGSAEGGAALASDEDAQSHGQAANDRSAARAL